MRKKIILAVLLITIALNTLQSQPWGNSIKSEKPTLKDIQNAFYDYWKDKTIEKGKGYKPFKRWESYWETRVLVDGSFPSPSITLDNLKQYNQSLEKTAQAKQSSANWTFKGPATTPGGYNGLGRINCIAFHPTNINTFWVGTPAGGLWKTINGGTTWTTNTDNTLPVLGISDIAIDPSNPNVMYIATGDGENALSLTAIGATTSGDTKSIGILKSTDGGNTWSTTGMNWSVTSAKLIRRLIINPTNSQVLIAATSDGIWRTTNGGTTWTKVQTGYFMDVEFKPTDPTIVYASTYSYGNAQIYRSINSGLNWASVATLTDVTRINLAVSANYPNLVDALCANTQSGLAGLWFSSNSGSSFSNYFNANSSNNLLHNSYNASGTGGQGDYDLVYAINPSNSNDIWLGGVNTWNSRDGGFNWYLKTMWANTTSQNPNNVPVVHADKHFIAFHPLNNKIMFECNDGGLYKTVDSGATWVDLSNGLGISQIYRIGVSQTVFNNVLCGLQDNGSRELFNNNWYEATGGDGMNCIIDYSNPSIEYASYANGVIYRTDDFWQTKATISNNIPGQPQGAWITPFVQHPTSPQTLYAGYNKIYKTIDRGNTWSANSPILSSADNIRTIAVAPSNTNTIYAATFDTFYVTNNGGSNWYFNVLPVSNLKISNITVHPTNPQILWLTISGYTTGQKVYKSINGGGSFVNVSGSLPNLPVNCIVYQNGTNDALYIGTDVGIFYRDASMSDWITYNGGLPNVIVTDLEIGYNNGKLWAGTFGRGLWNSDLFSIPISGNLITPIKKTISNVNIILSNDSVKTNLFSNIYSFSLDEGKNYTIRPTKNNDITKANGINATDVLFTQRHILNTTKLNSAYKIIAADVNGDKNINATDVLRIKRLILGIDTTFTSATKGNRLWEFVDSAYTFPDTTNPFPFKDSISFTNLTSNKINQTFIGVKLGDVNYDWNPLVAKGVEVKPVELVYTISNEQLAMSNSVVRIPITVKNFKDLAAMQYTLHFDHTKYEFVGIENNNLNIDFNSKQASENGNITMLWTDKNAVEKTLEEGTEIFVLVLRSTVNSRLSTDLKLTLTNDITEVGAWDKDLNEQYIILSKQKTINDKPETINEWAIYPNPTKGLVNFYIETLIGKGNIVIADVYGKQVKSQPLSLGTNTIDIANLSKGIYFVSIITSEGKTTKKLVVE